MNIIGKIVTKGEFADHEQVVLFSTAYASTVLTQNAFNISMSFLEWFKAASQVNSLKNDMGNFYKLCRIELISLIKTQTIETSYTLDFWKYLSKSTVFSVFMHSVFIFASRLYSDQDHVKVASCLGRLLCGFFF